MNNRLQAVFALLSLVCVTGCRPADEQSAIRGTFTVMADESLVSLLEQETAGFVRLYPDMRGSVAPTTTRGAIVALLNDSVSVIAIDRPLNAEELRVARQAALELTQTDFAIDGLSVLVHRANRLPSLRLEGLKDILNRTVSRWDARAGLGTDPSLRIVMTGPNSGVYELLSAHFFTLKQPLIPDRVLGTQREVLEAVARDGGALGIVSHSFYTQARRDSTLARTLAALRVVPLVTGSGDSTTSTIASQRSLYLGEYPLHFTLSLVSAERRVGPAAGFASFITSVPGQKIVQDAGLLPVKVPVRPIELTQEQLQ